LATLASRRIGGDGGESDDDDDNNNNSDPLEDGTDYDDDRDENSDGGGGCTLDYSDYYHLQAASTELPPTPSWRLKDRMKTVGIGIVLALNIGTDPPDLIKPNNGAVLEAWMDPSSVSRSKAREMIGERLEQQYGRWQLARGTGRPAIKFRRVSDPTIEDVRALCFQLRRQAKNERILFHYNGRGVPRPTPNGEIWVFDKNHTEYIPLPVSDLRSWLGKPTIVVLDCSAAGVLIPPFAAPLDGDDAGAQQPSANDDGPNPSPPAARRSSSGARDRAYARMDELSSRIVNDTIVLAPCSANEWLPVGPDYPADIFTACLTTPIPMALRWFVANHESTSMKGVVDRGAVDRIPGKATDRKTPLGELNWIFTAVTDSIAWNTLPRPMFQRLFRQDLLVASMFRNYLLAVRILRSLNCTPVSHPPLPPGMSSHPLWRAWDQACESLLFHLKDSILIPRSVVPAPATAVEQDESRRPDGKSSGYRGKKGGEETEEEEGLAGDAGPQATVAPPNPSPLTTATTAPPQQYTSPFFSEQLTAFEVWLEFAETHRTGLEPPEQLPVLLQVLLSQVHRIRALELLRRFLQLGPWAVNLGLGLGIFPYVMKLLQSQEYKSLLVSIWASIVRFDPSTRVDLLKDGALHQFIQHLVYGWSHRGGGGGGSGHPPQQSVQGDNAANLPVVDQDARERTTAAFVLAAAAHEYPAGQAECAKLQLHGSCCALLQSYEQGEAVGDASAESHFPTTLRLWLVLCFANMVKENTPTQNEALSSGVHVRLLARLSDRDSHVRAAVCYALGCLIGSPLKSGSRTSSSQDLSSLAPSQPHPAGHVVMQGAGPGGAIFSSPVGAQLRFTSGQQLQPSFALSGTAGTTGPVSGATAANLPWRPQSSADGAGRTVAGGAATPGPLMMQPQQQFQQVQPLRPGHQQYQGVSSQYMLQQPHYQSSQHPRGPSGYVRNNASGPYLNVSGQPMMVSPQAQPYQIQRIHEAPTRQPRPSVYEDRRRLEHDIPLMEALVRCTSDLSAVVRYESMMGLAAAVGKYLDAFVVAAEETSSFGPPGNLQSAYPFPLGFDRRYLHRFVDTWKALRRLQHQDPYPAVSKAANKVVSYVHEHLLLYRMEVDEANQNREAQPGEIVTEGSSLLSPSVSEVPRTPIASLNDRGRATTTGRMTTRSELRRVSSEVTSRDDASLLLQSSSATKDDRLASLGKGSSHAISSSDPLRWSFSLPRSELYEWKKKSFDPSNSSGASDDAGTEELDLLSPVGAARAYQHRRNNKAYKRGLEVAARYSCLAPKPQRKTIDVFFDEDNDETTEAAVEEEVAGKKRDLKMLEKLVLSSGGTKTSMLHFHSFEDVLVSCGGRGCVTVWDTANKAGGYLSSFDVGNAEHTRMTTSGWISEESSSLFYVGCDDGSVRIWGSLIEESGGIHRQSFAETKASLRAAFTAVGMKAGGRGTSGLVCEWHPHSGLMLAGGNATVINVTDLEAERQVCQIETGTDANVTTITTAWDNDPFAASTWAHSGTRGMGGQNVGPQIFVSGHSDGSIKIFDLRAQTSYYHRSSHLELSEPTPHSRRTVASTRSRVTGYNEHTGWVVATAFTGYAGRHELVSGTVSGTIKSWDLRMSGSLRTVEIQRSPMTALAVHSNIPLLASGSHAQFIKLVTLDGDPLQVLRYHEKMANHRIGPVSCLAFHRYKPILAAGSTDTFIGLYAPSSER
jgi:WD40 repeat protein